MGLLDDAIREHLELKRRAGADAREIAQLEHEAFGPIRRGDLETSPAPPASPEPAAAEGEWVDEPYADAPADERPAEPADDLDWQAPAAPAPGDEPRWEDEPVAGEEAYEEIAPPVPTSDPILPLEPARPHFEPEHPHPDAPRAHDHPPHPPEARRPQPPPAPADIDQPTAAYSLDELAAADAEASRTAPPRDVVPADDEPGEHDVLEETPEFLEETPEHDRLWFEQKPPRDFDF